MNQNLAKKIFHMAAIKFSASGLATEWMVNINVTVDSGNQKYSVKACNCCF
jgi:hypothetical protein